MFLAELGHLRENTLRPNDYSRRSLHHGLYDERSNRRMVLIQELFKAIQALRAAARIGLAFGTAVAVGGVCRIRVEQQPSICAVEQVYPPNAH